MSDQQAVQELEAILAQKLIEEGCVGDYEMGCTADDANNPLGGWCVNCLAGRLLNLLEQGRAQAPAVFGGTCPSHGVFDGSRCSACAAQPTKEAQ